jgi:hypothetical protein
VLYVASPEIVALDVNVLPTDAVPPIERAEIESVETSGEVVEAEKTVTFVVAPPTVTPFAPVTAAKK